MSHFATCKLCGHEMTVNGGCAEHSIQYEDGSVLPASTEHFDEPGGHCNDCNAAHGNYHHMGCDVERCPKCGGQLIGCNCGQLNYIVTIEGAA